MKYFCIIKRIFFTILGIFILSEILFLISPKIINVNSHKKEISEISKNITNTDFYFDEMSVKTYPDFSVKINAKNAELKNLAKIKDLELKVNLLKLIFDKLAIKTLKLEDSDINVIVFKDNSTNLDGILNPKGVSLDLKTLKLNVKNYKMVLNDEKTSQKININGEYINAEIKKNELEATIKGEITEKDETSKIDLSIQAPMPDIKKGFKNKNKYLLVTGYIKNLRPEIFENYLRYYFVKDLKQIKGVINADFSPIYENNELKTINTNITIDDLKIISKEKENSIIFNGKNIIKAKTDIDKKLINIKAFEFSGDGYKITAKGLIDKFKTKHPKLNLDINIDNTKIEKLYWFLPSTLFSANDEIRKLKKYGAYGIADGNLQLKGDILKPETYGNIDFKEVWILDGLPDNVPKATVKTNFRKDIVDVDVKVWASEKEYVTVKGYSDFFDLSNNLYQINSTQNVPLEVVQKMLPPISDVLGFVIGPVPMMDIKGLGNIDLEAGGSQKDPILNGYFNFKNASASFNDIKILKLENSNGRIDFKKDKVYFKNETGTILGQKAEISGVSDIKVDLDYTAKVNNAPLNKLLQTLKTSPMLKEYAKQVQMIETAEGRGDIYLNLKGHIDDPKAVANPEVIKLIKPKGSINIKNAKVILKSPKAELYNTNGKVDINEDKVNLDLVSTLFTSPLMINGKIIKNNADITINSDKMRLVDSAKVLISFYSDKTTNLNDISKKTAFMLNMKYKGSVEKIDLNKVDLKAVFPEIKSSVSKVDVLSGKLFLKNGDLKADNINAKFYNTTAYLNGRADNLFKKPLVNLDMKLYKFDLSTLNNIKKSSVLPQKYKKILNAYKNYKGIISSKLNIKNNNINGNIWLRDISFSHAILDYPFSINSADFNFKNGNLEINSFNSSFAGTPIFMKGNINSLVHNPKYNINFSSKLSKDFVDNYINTNLSYPINIKGEILLSSQISGAKDTITILSSLKLEEGADISYMGANLGDENSIREIKGEIQKTPNKILIKNLDYSKYIYNQNNRLYPLPMVKMNSSISQLKNKPFIDYMNIKTNNPIGANILNAILKKSLIKGGNVTCDAKISGYADNPKITGITEFKNVDIPFYETHIDDIIINFSPKYVDLKSQIDYFNSDMNISAKVRNNGFKKIYIDNIDISSKKTDLNKLLHALNELSYKTPVQIVEESAKNNNSEQILLDLKNLVIEKGSIKTDTILYKNLPVNNISSKISFKNNNFKLTDTSVDIAGGKLSGDFGYNLEKALITVNASVKGVDANKVSEGLLDIKNQIHGSLDGTINITTFGADDTERTKNLNGKLAFSVNNGKMPKLGSLEYLLRAGNLLKSGISGLTLNNITGLLLPVQQGDFDTIQGDLEIKNGTIDDMKIYSKGKNLSILITGSFDLETSKTDLNILGKLSKNINTVLGPVGNTSLNSFFNLIPGVHLDELKDTEIIKQINSIPELSLPTDKFRIFRATVDGDIYSNSFVSKFEWVNK